MPDLRACRSLSAIGRCRHRIDATALCQIACDVASDSSHQRLLTRGTQIDIGSPQSAFCRVGGRTRMLWIACSLAMLGADPVGGADGQDKPMAAEVRGCQWQATSANFSVRNHHLSHDARKVAEHCERWRTKLQKYWIAAEQEPWTIK